MNKRLKKILKISFIVFLVCFILATGNDIFAAINPEVVGGDSNYEKGIISRILDLAIGPLTMGLTFVINVIVLGLYIAIYIAFSPLGDNAFPYPDSIIFNKIAFFDPNFINPNNNANAPVFFLKDTIRNFYYTGFTIAGSIFVIAAMIIGIKLALTNIAEEKSHYKQMITSWVSGVAMLFLAHFLMYVVFTVNETIVHEVSKPAANMQFSCEVLEAIPVVGKTISAILPNLFNSDVDLPGDITAPGFRGIITIFTVKAVGGNIIYSIILGALLGQSCALIFMYIRRLFYCILLGILAPLIIATDILKQAVGNTGSKLFNSWFKNFSLTVMLQSFQAVFLLFIMIMLKTIGEMQNSESSEIILGIMSLFSVTALVRLEKLIKNLFGIEDGMIGNIKNSGAKMFAAIKMGNQMYDNLTEPKKRQKAANKKVAALGSSLGIKNPGKYATPPVDMDISNKPPQTQGTSDNIEQVTNSISGDQAGANAVTEKVREYGVSDAANNMQNSLSRIEANTAQSNNSSSRNVNGDIKVGNVSANNISAQNMPSGNVANSSLNAKEEKERKEKIKKQYDEYNAAVTEATAARRDRIRSNASAIAGMSLGLGAFDETTEAVAAGGAVSNFLDKKMQEHVDNTQKQRELRATGKDNYLRYSYIKEIKGNEKENASLKNEINDMTEAIKDFKNASTKANKKSKDTTIVNNNYINKGNPTPSNGNNNGPIRTRTSNNGRKSRNASVDDL